MKDLLLQECRGDGWCLQVVQRHVPNGRAMNLKRFIKVDVGGQVREIPHSLESYNKILHVLGQYTGRDQQQRRSA